ncbi:MAG: hypothetical protein LBT40_15090 [Deltaproteobacteria bacterium]|nr:hypothetical protein [Deltaproteobacteria bacterium]
MSGPEASDGMSGRMPGGVWLEGCPVGCLAWMPGFGWRKPGKKPGGGLAESG